MTNQSETFGRLLRGAINSIAAYEGKTAAAIEEELGAAIGISGAAIQRYKAGFLPPEPRTTQILSEAAVRRGFLSRAWLQRFLQAARYPSADTLLAQLGDAPATGSTQPGGTLVFLFTDIAGSTTLWEQQPQAMERALERHDAIMRQAIDAYGGHVFKTVGDAFYAVFTTAADALDSVLAAQRAIQSEAWGTTYPIRVRAALHAGVAQQRDGDYFGAPLNRVARLCAAGHGGQVLLSLAAQELVRDLLPKGVALRDLGEHRLKDLIRPERIFQVAAPDLPTDFPALRTLDSYRHNLPPQATPLIGRETEVAAVCGLLRNDDTHLLTLTGPGGTGKTRLALQAAAELLDDFHDGVFFIPLAPFRDPQFVVGALAQALGVKEQGDRPLVEQLKAYVREKRALLLLDNFEQVAAAAPLVAELLVAAPGLKVIVTSRETLHLYGEREYGVPPLSMPDLKRLPPIERLTQYEAVRLFIERAQAVRPDFAVTADNAPAVAEVCAQLDGLPLAIELAAARSKLFPPRALLARLGRRLALLTGGARDLPARQQTLRDAIAWSYDLLDAAEQSLFARLGVFVGGCSLPVAEAVLGDDSQSDTEFSVFIAHDAVLDGLSSLVDKSLLKQIEGVGGESRFVMLETIREYALEQLVVSGEEHATRQRHSAYFLALAEQAEAAFHGPQARAWMDRLEADYGNLRAALAWAVDCDPEGALRLGGALADFWLTRGHLSQGRQWLERALSADPQAQCGAERERTAGASPYAAAARAKAFHGAGKIAHVQEDNMRAQALFVEGQTLALALGDPRRVALLLNDLGELVLQRSDFAQAMALYTEGLALARAANDGATVAHLLLGLGDVVRAQGNVSDAGAYYQESLAIGRTLDDRQRIAWALHRQGELALEQGPHERAVDLFAEGLALARDVGDQENTAWLLHRMGWLLLQQRNLAGAAAQFVESAQLLRVLGADIGVAVNLVGLADVLYHAQEMTLAAQLLGTAEPQHWPVWAASERAEFDRSVAAIRAQLDQASFVTAWEAGRKMAMEQVLAEALAIATQPRIG